MIPLQTLVRMNSRPFRWTRDDYFRVAELGVFDGHRVELIDGEVIEMSPPGSPHSVTVELAERALEAALGPAYWIRTEQPLNLSKDTVPQPDLSVVRGNPRDFLKEHPNSSLLVVEVSDSSIDFDASHKASLYARGGIEEYWIVNLAEDRLDVYRKPIIDTKIEFGARYAEVRSFRRGETVGLLAVPTTTIRIDDLLP